MHVLEHLLGRMHANSNHLTLDAHTLWALMLARPGVLDHQPALRACSAQQIDRALDSPGPAARTHPELAGVAYAIRLAGR